MNTKEYTFSVLTMEGKKLIKGKLNISKNGLFFSNILGVNQDIKLDWRQVKCIEGFVEIPIFLFFSVKKEYIEFEMGNYRSFKFILKEKEKKFLIEKIVNIKEELVLEEIEADILEAERKTREEAECLEVERKAREEVECLEAERKARKEAERLEAERKAHEEAERLEAERKVREEAERLEAERKTHEEAERLEAERKVREEAERLEAERKAREEAERLEAERKVREEAERLEAERKACEKVECLEAERKTDEEIMCSEQRQEETLLEMDILKTKEQLFFDWCIKTGYKTSTSKTFLRGLKSVEKFLSTYKIYDKKIYDISVEDKVYELISLIENHPRYSKVSHLNNIYALKAYARFLSGVIADKNSIFDITNITPVAESDQKEVERLEEERKVQEEAKRLEEERKAQEEAERLEEERKAREEAERLEEERKAQEEAKRLEAERRVREQAERQRLEDERKALEKEEHKGIEYLCTQVKNRKNIGADLIDILDDKTVMEEIHSKAEYQLILALATNGRLKVNNEIIVVSLVLIAMLEYDGNYYANVRNTYLKAYANYSQQKVEGLIRTILSKYKRQADSGSRTRIINVVLENAIVPKVFLSAFFEFIFDIYKMNFEYDLPENMYEDFRFVYDGLRNNMLSDGDELSLNATQKTYKLIAATKQLIKYEDGLDAIVRLSIILVKIIDKRYWNKEIKVDNPYLKAGYESWEKQFRESARGKRERGGDTPALRSRWEPKYAMDNHSIYLETPIHKVKSQYDYKEISVVVFNNEEEIYRKNDFDIREIIGGYQINSQKIKLDNPLERIRYKLVAGNEIIYDSKDKLYRNYIVFNGDGQEISNNTDFEGTAFFCYKQGNCELENLVVTQHYCIGYKLVRYGDAIEIGYDIFSFSAMAKPGIFGKVHQDCYIRSITSEQLIPVYKEINALVFEADNQSTKFEIVVNGKPYKLNEMQYKSDDKGVTTKYIVELSLSIAGIYNVEVNQLVTGNKNRILKELFAYDEKLEFSTKRIDDHSYRIKVFSSLLPNTLDMELCADEFNQNFIQFECAGEMYILCLPFELGYYSLCEVQWNSVVEDIWIEDIKMDTVLTLYDSSCDGVLVYNEKGVLAEDNIRLRDCGYYKSVPVYFLNSYRNENKYMLLVFISEGKAKYALRCYNKCVMEVEKTEIVCSDHPKSVTITPVFHGKNKVFYEVFNQNEEKIYKSKPLACGEMDVMEQFQSFEEYIIRFHENTKTLQLRKNTLLYEVRQTFYVKKDFVGRTFKIQEIYYNQSVRKNFLEKMWHLSKAYVRLTNVIDEEADIFEGEVFVKTLHGEWVLDKINPVEVEICSEVIDDTMDIYITNQGDGLLVDLDKHGILNSLEHPTAPDIFLYTLSTKGEI